MSIKMKKMTVLVQSAVSVGIAASLASLPVYAQQGVEKVEKVEVTGSSIKRINAETALPVTIIRVDDLKKAGVTTAEEAIGRIASSQSSLGISQGVGATTGGRASANLRGLGGNKTLVLLNGRRVANHAYDSATVDLNAIPLAAIERIEVLRDGASAIYGTDAIGGVINFITRKDYDGAGFAGEIQLPQTKGGEEMRATLSAGTGSLQKDRYNLFGTFDYRMQDALKSTDRSFASTGNIPDRGLARSSGTTFPGNVTQASTGVSGNPTLPGCRPPSSFPAANGKSCRFDFVNFIDLIPQSDQYSFLGKGSLALGESNTASIEYLRAENKTTNRVAPTPLTQIVMPSTSPYFPGKGLTPGIPGLDPNADIRVGWRTIPAGQRTNSPVGIGERAIAALDGNAADWDYKTALTWTRSTVNEVFTNGYISSPDIRAGVAGTVAGRPGFYLNPFGAPTPAEDAYINASKVIGEVITAQGTVKGIDARASRELLAMPAGPLGLAIGGEYRKEDFNFILNDGNIRRAASSGLELAQSVNGNRNASALFGELSIPITKQLEVQLAVRHDRYSDFGSSTNPKIALRFQPVKEFLARASYNTGFRAPTLYEINQPEQLTNTSDSYSDPVLCPGGVPAAGADPARDCDQQFNVRQAGNKKLDPEKSRTATLGFVFEPLPSFTASLDFWDIHLKNQITTLPEQAIFGDPAKYAARFVRCSQIDPALATTIDACSSPNALAYVDNANENLGDIKTRGIDIGLNYRFPATSLGRFSFGYDGTYVSKYDYQRERGGEFVKNVGKYVDATPVFRWQHTLTGNWSSDQWSAQLSNRFKSGYEDQNDPNEIDPQFFNKVESYSIWDTSISRVEKDLTVTVGVKNLANTKPPFSNQGSTFQVGYDPRFTDPLGRMFIARVQYDFKK